MADEPPYLAVGTGVSAKYKGAFCEAKIRKVVRSVKCKVLFKQGLGSATVADDQIKGMLRTGATVEAKHPERKEYIEATITKIQDCSQYTVVFDDGDITTLRRTALCLKSGRHFAESETLDQLPLTHPEHFSTPVIGGRRGRRTRIGDGSSDEDDAFPLACDFNSLKEVDIGRVVCVEGAEKKKTKDNWFPGLIVAPTAQDTVEIHVKDEYLVRSFKDGRYYTVPKKETTEFTREVGLRVDNNTLKAAVDKAIQFLDRDELPPHWDRELLLYGLADNASDSEPGCDNESSDDEPREEKDHFVAQLYKFMDDSGTPINRGPTIGSKDVDLYRLFKVVQNLGGYNRVTNHNNWKTISVKMGFGHNPVAVSMVKQSYKKFLYSFEEFYRKLGCTMVNHPRLSRNRNRSSRSLIRDKDRTATPTNVKGEKNEKLDRPDAFLSSVESAGAHSSTAGSEVEENTQEPILEELVKLVSAPLAKEKIVQRRSSDVPIVPPKIKEEKKDEPVKEEPPQAAPPPPPPPPLPTPPPVPPVVVKEVKKEVRPRAIKVKPTEAPVLSDEATEKVETKEAKESSADEAIKAGSSVAVGSVVLKEKKKRLFTRIASKKDKCTKVATTDCLATTRQKRTIKEKVKAFVDHMKIIKNKALKMATPSNPGETSEKAPSTSGKNKVKEEPVSAVKVKKEEPTPPNAPPDDKKKGRKKKEKLEPGKEQINQPKKTYELIPTTKPIAIGDRLKVFYGPTQESKVTYEAKVLNVRVEQDEVMYLVHYTGWNNRYDEWIRPARIADNLSYVPGRTPKKQAQSLTPKSAKKEKKQSKSDVGQSISKIDSSSFASKEKDSNSGSSSSGRQGSVGRCTTPSSVSSSSGRTKATTKRAYTRSVKRELSTSETEQEYESDATNDNESSSRKSVSGTEVSKDDEGSQPERKRRRRRLAEESKADTKIKMEKDEESPVRQKRNSKKRSIEKSVDTEDIPSRKIVTKAEMKLREDSDDETKDSVTVPTPPDSQMCKEVNTDPIETDESAPAVTLETTECGTVVEDSVKSDTDDIPELDSESTQIRSEDTEEAPTIDAHMTDNDTIDTDEKPGESETEDVYEFKEPEPFEFETRKNLEDKIKLPRRTLNYEEVLKTTKKKTPESSSPAKPTSSPNPSDLLILKDENSQENAPTIQTCEEAFDKICASPLRAATQETGPINIELLGDHLDNYDDNYDDDSEDRLVISERDSDNYSTVSNEKEPEVPLVVESQEAPVKSPLKPPTPEKEVQLFEEEDEEDTDDDGEDEEEDEVEDDDDEKEEEEEVVVFDSVEPTALYSIKSAINDESEEESADELRVENKEEPVQDRDTLEKDEDSDHSEKAVDQQEGSTDEMVVEEASEEITDDNIKIESTPELIVPAEELPVEMETETDIIKDDGVEEKEDTEEEKMDEIVAEKENLNVVDEVKLEDDEENNIDSLICEETIPGSPPPLMEPPKVRFVPSETEDMKLKLKLSSSSKPFKIEDTASNFISTPKNESTTPPISSDSSSSSLPSPSREPETPGPSGISEKVNPPRQETRSFEKETAPKKQAPEPNKTRAELPETSKTKKPEPKSGKKGRKTRKKSEETGKRKYNRKHHAGSDSDEAADNSGEASQPSAPRGNRYNFLVTLGPEMDSATKIAKLSQAIQDVRKAHADVKAELAAIDRRRKKLRRRERENAVNNNR